MRIVIIEFTSLDGIVQAPGGAGEDTDGGFAHGGWSNAYFDPEVVGGTWDSVLERADALLYGRRTWQVMAAAWPQAEDDPFAGRMNAIRKYVVSGTLGEADLTWNNSQLIAGGEALEVIRGLRAGGGRDLVLLGSASLARTLLAEGLVDELRLIVMPVLLGGGKSLYPTDGGKRPLELVSTTTSPAGVNVCTYRVLREG
ncbi:dihydrofolate reductase family protein [Streptomyces sp. BBFR102]|uniref:dihydrofolate reductase family protein n=1 Tax=Streptomyces sp. BBFR102 TaxID=3448171 RepID=UPI003F52C343